MSQEACEIKPYTGSLSLQANHLISSYDLKVYVDLKADIICTIQKLTPSRFSIIKDETKILIDTNWIHFV